MIDVKKLEPGVFEVVVHGDRKTTHTVTLSEDYYRKLTGGHESEEQLIERSFEFLLEREPNTSILATFDLPVINGYFPAFEKEISGPRGEG